MSTHNPILCIVPPHILTNIAQQGTEAQRSTALQTITASEAIRGHRQGIKAVLAYMAAAEVTGNKERKVYDAKNGSGLPGTLVRQEGGSPVTDPAVNEAYDGSGFTYDLYSEIYGRNSIDGNGLPLISTVHYQKGYDNAFWNGQQMVYGDGDEDLPESQRLFNRFTSALDVIGHELTHGVTSYEANLAYFGQPGALNESFSDVFGSLVKQRQLQQSASEADWIIGEGLFTANVNGVGIRSMKAPGTAYDDPVLGKDPQPAHMNSYVNTIEDNGGVHINSGIPNRAFYVVATEIGGYAWEKAGQIWYKALTEKLNSGSNFQNAVDLTYQTAGELFGENSLEQQAVKTGWAAVGLAVGGSGGNGSGDGCLKAVFRALGLTG